MNKVNVGVFPCGSEVGLEVHRALKYYRHFHLVGLSSVDDHGRMVYEDYVGDVPYLNHVNFLGKIKEVVKKADIQFLIPAMDEAGYLLKKNESSLSCEVVYPDLETAQIIRRKTTTYEKLKNIVQTPEVFCEKEEIYKRFPVFVKPDIGYGSRGARKVQSKDELDALYSKFDNLVVMELLPGEEYTIDCFSSAGAELLFAGARKRSRIRMGISVASETVSDQSIFREVAFKINQTLGMRGLWFFQLKRNKNGKLTLLEVAGRVSGSMALYRGLGINFIASDLFQRLGNDITLPKISADKGYLERAFDCTVRLPLDFSTVYCDLDDCLIFDGKRINTKLVQFLFQCLNANKKLILLTRHQKIPDETLKRFRLTSLFDEVIHIQDETVSKATAIKNDEKAIFIDDSFVERQSVAKMHNIPTFAPDAVDLLISKKL